MIESGYLGVENYGRARGHVGDSEVEEEEDEEEDEGDEEEKGDVARTEGEGRRVALDKDPTL